MPRPEVSSSKHQWEVRASGLKRWKCQIIHRQKIKLDGTEEKKNVQESRQRREAREGKEGTKLDLIRDLFKTNEEALSRLG